MSAQPLSEDQLSQAAANWVKGIVSLFLDPWTLLEDPGGSGDYKSVVFTVTSPPAGTRSLAVVDDLKPGICRVGHPEEALPKASIRFEPAHLGPQQQSFRLVVDAATAKGHPGGTYRGSVNVCDENTPSAAGPGIFSSSETVPVWIVIP
jgi:hypothetical protein